MSCVRVVSNASAARNCCSGEEIPFLESDDLKDTHSWAVPTGHRYQPRFCDANVLHFLAFFFKSLRCLQFFFSFFVRGVLQGPFSSVMRHFLKSQGDGAGRKNNLGLREP